jgi:hypothetical protein
MTSTTATPMIRARQGLEDFAVVCGIEGSWKSFIGATNR